MWKRVRHAFCTLMLWLVLLKMSDARMAFANLRACKKRGLVTCSRWERDNEGKRLDSLDLRFPPGLLLES